MAEWRREILENVSEIELTGVVPGVLIVFGEQAHPVVANESGQVLCAAAQFGKGRVFVMAHNSLVTDFAEPERNVVFNKNLRNWLIQNPACTGCTVREIEEATDFEWCHTTDIATWNGNSVQLSEREVEQVVEWVENGGSLVCGACSWGFAYANKKKVTEMRLTHFMEKIGICFAGENTFNRLDEKALITENEANLVRIEKALLKDNNWMKHLKEAISHIPHNVYVDLKSGIEDAILSLEKELNYIPTAQTPVSDERIKNVTKVINLMMIRDGLDGKSVKAEGIDNFPGSFEQPPKLEEKSISFTSNLKKFHVTGCYLPAGVVMKVSWDATTQQPWSIVVGLHSDELRENKDPWKRWPNVSIRKELRNSPMVICSPFGGLVYLESPDQINSTISIELQNVVFAPIFTYETKSNWSSVEKGKPGLWCDIIGQKIVFTVPSKAVRNIHDMEKEMRIWDKAVTLCMELRGTDPSKGRGEWLVADQQLAYGYMHAGYPIMTHLDVMDPGKPDDFLFNTEKIVKGNGVWGAFHEIGHQFQDDSWTWSDTMNVTVNIFTLYAVDLICKKNIWIHPWLVEHVDAAKEYLKNGADIEEWRQKPGVALFIYTQLARDFGWDAYKTVFRLYNSLSDDEKPKTRSDKEQQWITRFSKTVKRNLCPMFEFWGWPVSTETKESLVNFEPYMPDDEFTNDYARERATSIAKRYKVQKWGTGNSAKATEKEEGGQHVCPTSDDIGEGGWMDMDDLDIQEKSK